MAEEWEEAGSVLPGDFRMLVAQELTALRLTPIRWHADGVDCQDADGEDRYLGLANLYRRAKGTEREEWPGLIQHFFGIMQQATSEGPEMPRDLAEVRDRLRVRVGKPFQQQAKMAVWQYTIPGTELAYNLVIDSDQYMMYVTEEMMTNATEPPETWLRCGLDNLFRATPEGWLNEMHAESGIQGGHSNDSYDAARVLLLDRITASPPGGWLVAIPARDWLFALPVSVEKLSSIGLLKLLAEKSFGEDAYPVSDLVYWIREGVWEVMPIELTEEGAKISPSDRFIDMLNKLEPEDQQA
ncbi:MAG: hypothetical protein ACRC8S_11200 [Fimbriiglobus sp.]